MSRPTIKQRAASPSARPNLSGRLGAMSWSQAELSIVTSIPTIRLSRIIGGRSEPSPVEQSMIAVALDIDDLDWLFAHRDDVGPEYRPAVPLDFDVAVSA